MDSMTSSRHYHYFPKLVARAFSMRIYFFQKAENKRQSVSQSCVLSAPVVLKERSAWTTHSRNKSHTEYGQEQLLLSVDLVKDLETERPVK